ncbi:hypothetical protein HYS97_01105 [Candidatus Daviesbacteria bacterium]|nr:hypothetical protein [Candidatus Daviesbacteria bacterium]
MSRRLSLRVNLGRCPDYHCHIERDGKSAGVATTIRDLVVYIEPHGESLKGLDIEHLGRRQRDLIRSETARLLRRYPSELVRRPSLESGKAKSLGRPERL